uniref:Uncharacterized protein n=1 Tax=Arundo donax TaxID=35708 RepID=A0A0A9FQ99_ARUDO
MGKNNEGFAHIVSNRNQICAHMITNQNKLQQDKHVTWRGGRGHTR